MDHCDDAPVEHLDVLIIGAGLAGVGAACHLRLDRPDRTFAVLEARGAIGGTWDLFRYPGVRSDSDMFTLGYTFNPWRDPKAIADGDAIREYIRDTARELGIEEHIRLNHKVVAASWSTAQARWTVRVQRTDTAEQTVMTCGFLFACTGYYRYDQGYLPSLPGLERFAGPVVHPQQWPDDLDWTGKRVLVVGSGATAVTLVPAMAEQAAHVTMLQRSPGYIFSVPSRDPLAELLLRLLPSRVAYPVARWKNILVITLSYQVSRRWPEVMKKQLRRGVAAQLPADFDVSTHFTPRYDPWDQRLCVVPDGDLLTALRTGRASVVTGTIDTFTEHGVRLDSGEELAADVVITATGLEMLMLGGMTLSVDGRDIDLGDTVAYKGMMLSGVPNFAITIGYSNQSWTLKVDLVATYVCRLLRHMRRHGYRTVTPAEPPADARDLLIDMTSGYVLRGLSLLPKQGRRAPWRLYQNYPRDVLLMRYGRIEDEGVRFSGAQAESLPAAATSG